MIMAQRPLLRRLRTVDQSAFDAGLLNWLPRLAVIVFLFAFREANAISLRTFFQPDEFFQSLEPAWKIAFGADSGAWITWEWRHQLRSSIHPYIFAAVYYVADTLAGALQLAPLGRADLLIAAPRLVQGGFAAVMDYYTWTLAQRIYGVNSHEAWCALLLSLINPWQWFCSPRTLSNCLETTLTIVALNYWQWRWPSEVKKVSFEGEKATASNQCKRNERLRLQRCLLYAAIACILRPTNIIIWITLAYYALFKSTPSNSHVLRGTTGERFHFFLAVISIGSSVLLASSFFDYNYFGTFTLTPLRFLYYNIAQSLAIFYGVNDWHYYIRQGFPLLLTTCVPFALVGMVRELFSSMPVTYRSIKRQLAMICLILPGCLSFISHKEVRFIYPLLPVLHILASPSFVQFFGPATSSTTQKGIQRGWILMAFLFTNFCIGYYTSTTHASGGYDVFSYLRGQYVNLYSGVSYTGSTLQASTYDASIMTVGFLMPCHSTPWRSHFVFPGIHAWALSCEPPVDLEGQERLSYLDEADQFYANSTAFLKTHMAGGLHKLPKVPSYVKERPALYDPTQPPTSPKQKIRHDWPDYLVFFQQLEPQMQKLLNQSSYGECYRTFNTAWHDDWRRKGDMIVWCLDREMQKTWREINGGGPLGHSLKHFSVRSAEEDLQSAAPHVIDKVTEKMKSFGRRLVFAFSSNSCPGCAAAASTSSPPTYTAQLGSRGGISRYLPWKQKKIVFKAPQWYEDLRDLSKETRRKWSQPPKEEL